MRASVIEYLKQQMGLVDIRRDVFGAADIRGRVVGVSSAFAMVSVVSNELLPSGFYVIRLRDISFLRWGNAKLKAWEDALAALCAGGQAPPPVDLTSWETIIKDIGAAEPIMTFHREGVDPASCYIGRNPEIREGAIFAEEVSTEGIADGRFVILLEDLTRVDFGGNYEKGLQRVLEREALRRSSVPE